MNTGHPSRPTTTSGDDGYKRQRAVEVERMVFSLTAECGTFRRDLRDRVSSIRKSGVQRPKIGVHSAEGNFTSGVHLPCSAVWVYSGARDPPGQNCVYIPPGDDRCEKYRLSTFEHFTSPFVSPILLAKHGFIFTGFYDRVKCFSCGRTVERWEAGDNPAERKWHKPDCLFNQGFPCGNIPIGSFPNTSTWQPMEVARSYTSQFMNGAIGPVMRIPTDVPETASTFQIQPGSSVVFGSSPNLPQSSPPVTSHPANPPASAPCRDWRMANVISADHKRHLTNLYLNRELDRLASFGQWPTGRSNVSPVALARAGFFYLGDMDCTQCFCCGRVLRNWSHTMEEQGTHFPWCRFVDGTERQNIPIPDRPETSRELAVKFPCRFPINPLMRREDSRVKTFDIRWSNNRTQAKPHEIAEAGFFLDGRNQVKCWYCNGGLQHWEYDDVPWIEHAKWFPNCQYLLSVKGQHFVYRHLAMNPQLPRPIIARQHGSPLDPGTEMISVQQRHPGDIPPSQRNVRQPSPQPTIIDPQDLDMRRVRVDSEMQNSETVKLVLLMGFSADTIRCVMLEKLESGAPFDAENIFEGTASLLDAVMKKEERKSEIQQTQATNIKLPSVSGSEELKRKVLAMFGDVKYPQKRAMLTLGLSKLGNLTQTWQEAIDDLLLRASNFLPVPLGDGAGLFGDDLFELIIRSIPSEKWMRFARCELCLTDPEIWKIKETCEPTDEQLIQLGHMIKERTGTQRSSSGTTFLAKIAK